VEAHRAWIAVGRPPHGQTFDNMKNNKYKYKLFLRQQRTAIAGKFTNALRDSLLKKYTTLFWK